MRTPSAVCRNGHRMSGKNLLWHTRYDPVTRERFLVRECRVCANARYRAVRLSRKRNQELEAAAALPPAA